MANAKEIRIKVIPSSVANDFVRMTHYSGKVVPNSTLHFGAFLDGKLHGVMSFGNSLDKTKVLGLVEGTEWNGMIELNRMAFDEYLPKNSESRCIAIAIRMLKKQAPHIKWVLSYADGSQCGDGTIYRASGFKLTQIKENSSMFRMPDGEVLCKLVLEPSFGGIITPVKSKHGKVGEYASWPSNRFLKYIGAEQIKGFQLRYIYFIDKEYEKKCTVPFLDFSEIEKAGAKMYKGNRPA